MSLRDEGRSMADRRGSDSLKKHSWSSVEIAIVELDLRPRTPNCRQFRAADNLITYYYLDFCPASTTQIYKHIIILFPNETNEKEACVWADILLKIKLPICQRWTLISMTLLICGRSIENQTSEFIPFSTHKKPVPLLSIISSYWIDLKKVNGSGDIMAAAADLPLITVDWSD